MRCCRRIFPPTTEEVAAAKALDRESQEEVEGSGVIVRKDETGEPQTKKAKTESQEQAKDDWEAVEKPSDAATEGSNELSEEGEKVEGVELAESDGEEVEKPRVEEIHATGLTAENKLAKDW